MGLGGLVRRSKVYEKCGVEGMFDPVGRTLIYLQIMIRYEVKSSLRVVQNKNRLKR